MVVYPKPTFREMSIDESAMEYAPTSPASRVLCGMLCSSPRHVEHVSTSSCASAPEQPLQESNDDDQESDGLDAGGNLPLHRAVERFAMDCLSAPGDRPVLEENIASLLQDDLDAVRTYNHRGYLPLHIACRDGASLAVIHTLVQVWPESVQCPTRDSLQMLPLHLVCRYHAGPARDKLRVLHYLLHAYPSAVHVANGKGDLALHLALQNYFSTLPVVELLVESCPESVRTVNDRHQLPLHIACAHHYMRRLAKKANSKSKTKATDRDDKENSCRSSDMIRYLLQEYPSIRRTATARRGQGMPETIHDSTAPRGLSGSD